MLTCPACGEENPERARFCLACGAPLGGEPETAAQEVRKTVTVVFSDVTGSTAIGELLDPETLRRVMTRYFDEMRDAVEAHGGVVEKFIGDAVMAVFGIPRLHEDDAVRAVRAAAEMRERLANLNEEFLRDRGITIAVRTGVNTGEVVAGDASDGQRLVTGDAVNVAARLEQAAQPGEILLGPATYALVKDAVDAEPVAPLSLKGKSEPVAASRLVKVHAGVSGHARRLGSPMVGRERQQRLLDEAFDQSVSERVCFLFTVLGSAGVGKSRLVNEFLASAQTSARVISGRCLSYGDGITFWPLAEALRSAAGIGDQEPAADALRALATLFDGDPEAEALAAQVAGLIGLVPAEATPEEAYRAVRRAFEIMAAERPLVVVFDDIHWAQPAFLDLIENLADWTRDAPVLLVCMARHDLLEARPSWGGGKLAATMIQLEPLAEQDSATLIANLLGTAHLDEAVGRRIAEAAEGNPLFVEEMFSMLIDDGHLVDRDGRWETTGDLTQVAVPPTIQALLAARLERLGPDERAVMERGAVEGKVFHRGAVSELAPEPKRAGVDAHLMTLVRKELVRPDRATFAGEEAYRFRHLLIRDAAYQAMPKEVRADLHERFASWLERSAGDRLAEYEEIVGYHLEQACRFREELGTVDDAGRALARTAAGHLAAAGDRAAARGDARAARNLVGRASVLLPADDAFRLTLQPTIGRLMYEVGEIEAAYELLEATMREAEAAGDRTSRARAHVFLLDVEAARAVGSHVSIVEDARGLVEEFEALGDEVGVVLAATVEGQFLFFGGRCAEAEALLARARERAQEAGLREYSWEAAWWETAALFFGPTPASEGARRLAEMEALPGRNRAIEAGLLRTRGRFASIQGRFDEARELLTAWTDIERELGRTTRLASVDGSYTGPLEMAAGRFPEAVEAFRSGYEAMTALGDRGYSATMAAGLAHALIEVGDLDEAERFARIALEAATDDDVEPQVAARGALAVALARRGDVTGALPLAEESVALGRTSDYMMTRADAAIDLGRVLAGAGRLEEALAAVDGAIEILERKEAWALVERARDARSSLSGR